jgi:hypothetical protein
MFLAWDRGRVDLLHRLHRSPCFAHLRGSLFEVVGSLSFGVCLPEMINTIVRQRGAFCRVCANSILSPDFEAASVYWAFWPYQWDFEPEQLLCYNCQQSLTRWTSRKQLPQNSATVLTWLSWILANRPKSVLNKQRPRLPPTLHEKQIRKSIERHRTRQEDRRDRLVKRVALTAQRHYKLKRHAAEALELIINVHPEPVHEDSIFLSRLRRPAILKVLRSLKKRGLVIISGDRRLRATKKLWRVYRQHHIRAYEDGSTIGPCLASLSDDLTVVWKPSGQLFRRQSYVKRLATSRAVTAARREQRRSLVKPKAKPKMSRPNMVRERRRLGETPAEIARALEMTSLQVRNILAWNTERMRNG